MYRLIDRPALFVEQVAGRSLLFEIVHSGDAPGEQFYAPMVWAFDNEQLIAGSAEATSRCARPGGRLAAHRIQGKPRRYLADDPGANCRPVLSTHVPAGFRQ